MVVILVKKNWVDEAGELAGDLLVGKHSDALKAVYGTKANVAYPFVNAELARTTGDGNVFAPVSIPVSAIRGMFDMTEAEQRRLGFF